MKRLLPLLLALAPHPGPGRLRIFPGPPEIRRRRPPPPDDYAGEQDGFRYTRTTLTPQARYLYDQLLAGLKDQAAEITDLYPRHRPHPNRHLRHQPGLPRALLVLRHRPDRDHLPGEKSPWRPPTSPPTPWTPSSARPPRPRSTSGRRTACPPLPQGGSDYDKALGIYTYVVNHADYQTVDSNSIVNIMVGGGGLRGCYAKTTQYLLAQVGIDAAYITGQAGGVPRLEPGLAGRHPLLDRPHLGRPRLHRRQRQPGPRL